MVAKVGGLMPLLLKVGAGEIVSKTHVDRLLSENMIKQVEDSEEFNLLFEWASPFVRDIARQSYFLAHKRDSKQYKVLLLGAKVNFLQLMHGVLENVNLLDFIFVDKAKTNGCCSKCSNKWHKVHYRQVIENMLACMLQTTQIL